MVEPCAFFSVINNMENTVLVLLLLIILLFCLHQTTVEYFVESDAIIYVMYHDEESYNTAKMFQKYEWARFQKLGNSIFFENAFFPILKTKQGEWESKQYVGLVSYNIVKKQNLKRFPLRTIIDSAGDADVITFFGYARQDLLSQATFMHPKFLDIWLNLLLKLGYKMEDILSNRIPMFPCNCWMAKPDWMKRYVDFAVQAMELLEKDEGLRTLCYNDSGYRSNLSKGKLIEISGKPYYTYHPFIMERLPCFFFWVEGANIYSSNIGVPWSKY